jgi:hypothetical protein
LHVGTARRGELQRRGVLELWARLAVDAATRVWASADSCSFHTRPEPPPQTTAWSVHLCVIMMYAMSDPPKGPWRVDRRSVCGPAQRRRDKNDIYQIPGASAMPRCDHPASSGGTCGPDSRVLAMASISARSSVMPRQLGRHLHAHLAVASTHDTSQVDQVDHEPAHRRS